MRLQFPIIIAVAVTIGVSVIASVIMIQRTPDLVVVESKCGAIVGSSWHFAGNTTISGNIASSICPTIGSSTGIPIPCGYAPYVDARKYVNDNGTSAYLVTGYVVDTKTVDRAVFAAYIVIIDSHVYCVSTNSTEQPTTMYNKCASIG